MPSYQYKAITETGTTVTGIVEADNEVVAEQMVEAKNYVPVSITETSKAASGGFNLELFLTSVKPQDIILFTKQFRTLLKAGVPVLKSLEILVEQTENKKLKDCIEKIANSIQQGSSMYHAFNKHTHIFPELYVHMIRAGEISGTLIEVLDRLIYIVEHEFKIKKDIKSAMTYPIIVIFSLIISFVVLVVFVLPNFVDMFNSAKIELPWPTKLLLNISYVFTHYWHIIVASVGGVITALMLYIKTKQGRFVLDTFLLHLPIMGMVFNKAALSRFGSIFAILQSSGVTVLETIKMIADTIGNSAIARDFTDLREQLEQGRGLSEPLKKSKYFTPMVISMLAIGEETGQLEEMMREMSKHYDYEVEYSVSRMSELIGPILTACLAVVVGFFALAIMLPLTDIMSNAMNG